MILGLLAVPAMVASAKTTADGGNWTNTATWSGGVVPTNGEDVLISAGHSVTVDVAVASLASLTNAGTLTFVGWSNTVVSAAVVYVSGPITHAQTTALTTNASGGWDANARVRFACATFFVASNGSINASGKGYQGGDIRLVKRAWTRGRDSRKL
jgi:hypothetical protein